MMGLMSQSIEDYRKNGLQRLNNEEAVIVDNGNLRTKEVNKLYKKTIFANQGDLVINAKTIFDFDGEGTAKTASIVINDILKPNLGEKIILKNIKAKLNFPNKDFLIQDQPAESPGSSLQITKRIYYNDNDYKSRRNRTESQIQGGSLTENGTSGYNFEDNGKYIFSDYLAPKKVEDTYFYNPDTLTHFNENKSNSRQNILSSSIDYFNYILQSGKSFESTGDLIYDYSSSDNLDIELKHGENIQILFSFKFYLSSNYVVDNYILDNTKLNELSNYMYLEYEYELQDDHTDIETNGNFFDIRLIPNKKLFSLSGEYEMGPDSVAYTGRGYNTFSNSNLFNLYARNEVNDELGKELTFELYGDYKDYFKIIPNSDPEKENIYKNSDHEEGGPGISKYIALKSNISCRVIDNLSTNALNAILAEDPSYTPKFPDDVLYIFRGKPFVLGVKVSYTENEITYYAKKAFKLKYDIKGYIEIVEEGLYEKLI